MTESLPWTDREYVYANAAAEKILGLSRTEILQRTYNQPLWKITTLKGHPVPDEETPFKKALEENQEVYGLKLIIERPDGERIIITTNATPMYDSAGNFDGVVGIFTDITEQHELQEQNITYHHTLTHDLYIPLSVIQDHAEMLLNALQEKPLGATALQNIEAITDSTEKMEGMITDLLDTARIGGGQVSLEKEPLALAAFVPSLPHRSLNDNDRKRVEIHIPNELPVLYAKKRRSPHRDKQGSPTVAAQ